MKSIVVNDTNVFIDLLNVGLLDEFFHLPWEVHTTDFVMYELFREGQKEAVAAYEQNGLLHVASFDFGEIQEINNLRKRYEAKTNVTLTDCSVWHYAKTNNYTMLTGDMKLRKAATKDGVEVHGLIYIFDKMVEYEVLTKQKASEKLKVLKITNKRQPVSEIDRRIDEWDVDKKKGGSY